MYIYINTFQKLFFFSLHETTFSLSLSLSHMILNSKQCKSTSLQDVLDKQKPEEKGAFVQGTTSNCSGTAILLSCWYLHGMKYKAHCNDTSHFIQRFCLPLVIRNSLALKLLSDNNMLQNSAWGTALLSFYFSSTNAQLKIGLNSNIRGCWECRCWCRRQRLNWYKPHKNFPLVE